MMNQFLNGGWYQKADMHTGQLFWRIIRINLRLGKASRTIIDPACFAKLFNITVWGYFPAKSSKTDKTNANEEQSCWLRDWLIYDACNPLSALLARNDNSAFLCEKLRILRRVSRISKFKIILLGLEPHSDTQQLLSRWHRIFDQGFFSAFGRSSGSILSQFCSFSMRG